MRQHRVQAVAIAAGAPGARTGACACVFARAVDTRTDGHAETDANYGAASIQKSVLLSWSSDLPGDSIVPRHVMRYGMQRPHSGCCRSHFTSKTPHASQLDRICGCRATLWATMRNHVHCCDVAIGILWHSGKRDYYMQAFGQAVNHFLRWSLLDAARAVCPLYGQQLLLWPLGTGLPSELMEL